MVINDLEWPMHSYYVIYYEKLKKIMQQTEKITLIVVSNSLHRQFLKKDHIT